jgi:hypothetical protein
MTQLHITFWEHLNKWSLKFQLKLKHNLCFLQTHWNYCSLLYLLQHMAKNIFIGMTFAFAHFLASIKQ